MHIYPDNQDAFSCIFLCICECILVLQTRESVKSYKMTFPNSFKGKKKGGKKKSDISDRQNSHHSKRKKNHASSDIFKLLIFEFL